MNEATGKGVQAAYDAVGRYRQDEINGFTDELLDQFLDACELPQARAVLDAMAGDGNLTCRLHRYCLKRGLPFPPTQVLEYSRVQAEFARHELSLLGPLVLWGDVLTMTNLDSGETLPDASFDRVLIKSSNHEIPLADQARLYRSVYRVLRPGGLFVNLGFLFDDRAKRDELREIARVKDRLAGMEAAVRNRYFLLREEFYGFLRDAGFVEVRPVRSLEYRIHSRAVAEQYFDPPVRLRDDLEFQSAQVRAVALRRDGRIRFDGDASVMSCPGEITVARRPEGATVNGAVAEDLLRRSSRYAALLHEAELQIPPGASVLDLGAVPLADAQRLFDVVTLLNVLHRPGIDAVALLRQAERRLRPQGRLLLCAPASAAALAAVEDDDLALLGADPALRAAHRTAVAASGRTWSLEGMLTLLAHLGLRRVHSVNPGLYAGSCYLIVAGR